MNPFSNSISNPPMLIRSNHSFPVCSNHQFFHQLQSLQQAQNLPSFPNQTQLAQSQNIQFSPTGSNQISPNSMNLQAFLNNQNLGLKYSQAAALQTISSQATTNFTSPRSNPELTNQINTMLLTWKLQNNLQTEFYKSQVLQLVEMQKDLSSKLAAVQSLPNKISPERYNNKSPEAPLKFKQEDDEPILQPINKKTLRGQIRGIIQFVLPNFGRISESQMEHEKERYEDPDLRAVFDALIAKYSSTIKTKEEMIKYTLRKAFKYIKKGVKKEMKLDSKEASNILCNKYFKDSNTKLPDFGDEEDFLKFLLPFRKCSKNKTMNSTFIHEVFSSDEFQRDYQTYLEDLDEILEADNNGKIERFVYFIEECIKKKKIQDIKKYKRIPWPELWVANTKKIAMELPGVKLPTVPVNENKRFKKGYSKIMISPHGSETSGSEKESSTPSSSRITI